MSFIWIHPSIGQTQFQSSTHPVHLIELYTSEGCHSCPPADRWLSELLSSEGLFSDFVPISFHVDYWNYLGWRDIYARAEYSQRQHRYRQLNLTRGVYTPGMFLDGREWRLWRDRASARFVQRPTKHSSPVGTLTLNYDRQYTQILFQPATKKGPAPARAFIALLGIGIQAPITSGENQGKTLHHDFVVLDLGETALTRDPQGRFRASLASPSSTLQAPKYALAAWITDSGNQRPLQATGGWIDEF